MKKKLPTLKDMWEEYNIKVVPKNASAVQRTETKRTFYSAISVFIAQLHELGEDAYSEDEGVTYLEGIEQECKQWIEEMMALAKMMNRN